MIREPAVNGQFYPAKKEELERIIEDFKPKETSKIGAKGIILPHAGYTYSGKVAVTTVSKVLPKKTLIILGPNHTGYGAKYALWAKGKWLIPFGEIEIEDKLAELILTKAGYLEEDYLAHKFEHSIEVELPILYHFFGKFKFVPIACQVSTLNVYRQIASQICEAVKNWRKDILFVVSTDMTHYEPELRARKKDRIALENIINLNEENLVKKTHQENITMCGVAAVAIFICCLKILGAKKAHVALYETSGRMSGDYNAVVGYAGVIIK